jgi:AAA domain, putative AbiEii toxin, Type IV TA system/AAA ATPase domain
MRIEHVRLINYKGFRDSGSVSIGNKFTVLVGQNNAGKTAFLEGLSTPKFQNKPFLESERQPDGFPPVLDPQSSITFCVYVTGQELKWRLLDTGTQIQMVTVGNSPNISALVDHFFTSEHLRVEVKYVPNTWLPNATPAFPLSDHPDVNFVLMPTPDRRSIVISPPRPGPAESIAHVLIGPYVTSALYVFRAERMNAAECNIEGGAELAPDAVNLASVLLQLQADPIPLERFIKYLRAIFPTIYSVVSRPRPNAPSVARIEVINKDPQQSELRPGISIPLADCGTGISQVLAILYVVVTARTSKVIVIDEPNSFLHPGAAKKLLAILKELDHQYIVTTHSSEIVRVAEPDVLHLVRWTGRESVIETLSSNDVKDLQRVLYDLGVHLSDVFGADNVLWVEGDTEEICFPLLLRHSGRRLSAATAMVAMVNTGDLESRRSRRSLAWEVYERLSSGSALIPPALAFSFDQEGRTQREMDDMGRRSGGRAHFLPRRTYENYLLDSEAISAVLQSSGITKSPADVEAWIAAHGVRREYCDAETMADHVDPRWPVVVNAPKLLNDLFDKLSVDAPLRYDKVVHSVALTEWLIANKPAFLKELVDYVVTIASPPVQ